MASLNDALSSLGGVLGENRTGSIMDAAVNRLTSSITGTKKTTTTAAEPAATPAASAAPASSGRPAWLLPAAFAGFVLLLLVMLFVLFRRRGRGRK